MCFEPPKCQMPRDRENNHTHRRQGTCTLRGEATRWIRRAGPGAKYGKHTGEAQKKVTPPLSGALKPTVRDIGATKESDHIPRQRHLRKRLDFYPGEARARRNTVPRPCHQIWLVAPMVISAFALLEHSNMTIAAERASPLNFNVETIVCNYCSF